MDFRKNLGMIFDHLRIKRKSMTFTPEKQLHKEKPAARLIRKWSGSIHDENGLLKFLFEKLSQFCH